MKPQEEKEGGFKALAQKRYRWGKSGCWKEKRIVTGGEGTHRDIQEHPAQEVAVSS